MIQDREIAKQISALMLGCSARLDDSLMPVMENCPEAEFMRYRRAIGKVLGEIFLEVMAPLYAVHPELKPPGLN